MYNIFKNEIHENNPNIEKLVILLNRLNKKEIEDIKKNLYIKYDQNTIQINNIEDLLLDNISIHEKIYFISKKYINDILNHVKLIKSTFYENDLIMFDIFKEMSIEKKLECFKNEQFAIYLKEEYDLNKNKENYCFKNIYNIYFKDLCIIVQEKELKDYYLILSYIFKDLKEQEIQSIQYRSNTMIELQKNIIEDKKLKIINI